MRTKREHRAVAAAIVIGLGLVGCAAGPTPRPAPGPWIERLPNDDQQLVKDAQRNDPRLSCGPARRFC